MIQDLFSWIHTQIQTNQFFGAAAFASIGAALFAVLKDVPKQIYNRILILITYKAVIYQTDELYDYILLWVRDNHKGKARNVECTLENKISESHEDKLMLTSATPGKTKEIKEIPIEDFFYMRKYGRFLKFSSGREKLENANNLKSVYLKSFTIKGIFASKAVRRILREINEQYGVTQKIPKYYASSYDYFYSLVDIKGKPLSEVIINKKLKKEIISDIETWSKSREEYVRRGIAFKRGHCFYGPPGTGKTTLAKAIALEYGMDIYSLNLRSVKNDEDLMTMLGRISANSILLFEDFDSHFVGRESTDPESKVTFSGLLNAIDGVIPLDDVLIIITTNHIEKLDQALLRPGRIDVVKEIGYATSTEASEYVSMFYNAQYTVKLSKPISMTNVQNACLANPQDPKLAIVQIEKM